MKNGLSIRAVERIAASMAQVVPQFDAKKFQKNVMVGLEELELKARVHHIIQHVHEAHNLPFKKFCRCLQSVPDVWDRGDASDSKAAFAAWPIIDYIAVHGLAYPKESLQTLEKLTSLFTAEFAVRPFIQQHTEISYQQLLRWCESTNEHVRRLASEGSRPRLPWGMQLPQFIADPQPLAAILQLLKADESLYVRRSVANNLNDISKDNTDWMIDLCRDWAKDNNPDTDWIIKHALRSLVKAGDARVFPLLGYTHKPKVTIENFAIDNPCVSLGKELSFSFDIVGAKKSQDIVVDYVIYFMKANGNLAPKVFKLKNIHLAQQPVNIQKSHSFKPISTRVYYPGLHQIAVQVNGVEMARLDFSLEV